GSSCRWPWFVLFPGGTCSSRRCGSMIAQADFISKRATKVVFAARNYPDLDHRPNRYFRCSYRQHRMTLQQLQYIVAVADTGQFSKAARSCHVTQPTLTMMVRKLEEELGVTIFQRKARPALPTT